MTNNDRKYWYLDYPGLFICFIGAMVVIFWIRECRPANKAKPAPRPEAVESGSGNEAWQAMRERVAAARKAAQPSDEEQEEAERLANWKANFPYQPLYHPTLKFDPALYDSTNPATWHGEGKKRMKPVIDEHVFMRGFFENELRFTKTFEDLYYLLKEHDRHDNPAMVAGIFNDIQNYHEAAAHVEDRDEVIMREVPTGEFDPVTGNWITMKVPAWRRTKMTWGEKADSHARSIVYKLHARKRWPSKEWMPEEEAMALRDRILAEITPANTSGYWPKSFVRFHEHAKELEEGDAFLIPKEGWVEAYWQWQDRASPIIARQLLEREQEARQALPSPPLSNGGSPYE
ncbi:MAG: hypothetical protein M2R45_02183 [Verrucomicrobia subdivision 3 bacterium]|nr:hypothetical protein [Limisphaerales bacterium]MCS1413759.1 hypothetical protein [Limisphaerales bacterium]